MPYMLIFLTIITLLATNGTIDAFGVTYTLGRGFNFSLGATRWLAWFGLGSWFGYFGYKGYGLYVLWFFTELCLCHECSKHINKGKELDKNVIDELNLNDIEKEQIKKNKYKVTEVSCYSCDLYRFYQTTCECSSWRKGLCFQCEKVETVDKECHIERTECQSCDYYGSGNTKADCECSCSAKIDRDLERENRKLENEKLKRELEEVE